MSYVICGYWLIQRFHCVFAVNSCTAIVMMEGLGLSLEIMIFRTRINTRTVHVLMLKKACMT